PRSPPPPAELVPHLSRQPLEDLVLLYPITVTYEWSAFPSSQRRARSTSPRGRSPKRSCARRSAGADVVVRTAKRLDGQDFLLFLFRDFFQFTDVIIGQLLHFGERVLFVVFGDEFVFEHLFQVIVAVLADVADGGSMLLQDSMDVFGELFPALFGSRRNWDTNQTAVVGGIQA